MLRSLVLLEMIDPSTILNKRGKKKNEHLCLLPGVSGEASSFSLFKHDIGYRCVKCSLCIVDMYPSPSPSPSRAFIMKGFLSKTFSMSIKMIVWFLSLILCDELNWLIFICWNIPACLKWSQLDQGKRLFFFMFLNLVCGYFIKNFWVCGHQRDLVCNFFFWVCLCLVLGLGWYWFCKKSLEVFFSFYILRNKLRNSAPSSSLNILLN